jgi:hypothetical protein
VVVEIMTIPGVSPKSRLHGVICLLLRVLKPMGTTEAIITRAVPGVEEEMTTPTIIQTAIGLMVERDNPKGITLDGECFTAFGIYRRAGLAGKLRWWAGIEIGLLRFNDFYCSAPFD